MCFIFNFLQFKSLKTKHSSKLIKKLIWDEININNRGIEFANLSAQTNIILSIEALLTDISLSCVSSTQK
jgi:hypothetical protein